MKSMYISDKEVCSILSISQSTLSRLVRGFHRGPRGCENEIDVRAAKPDVIGGYRRWNIQRLASVLGITEDELRARL